jgi:hypothetical protein
MVAWGRQGGSLPAKTRGKQARPKRALAACAVVVCALGSAAVASAAGKPVNDAAPEVVGTPIVGERLVCGAGSWSGEVSGFTYAWVRDGIRIAYGVTYDVRTADQGHSLWCIVTASGKAGSTEAVSGNSVFIPGPVEPEHAPEVLIPPEVSGTPAVGKTLTCSPGTWSGNPKPTFTYQWVRDAGAEEVIIGSAKAPTYEVRSEDQGHVLSCEVTATNSLGFATKPSRNSLPIPGSAPENTLPPRVLGIEPSLLGETLTCEPGAWNGAPPPTFKYQWVRDTSLIASATSSTYSIEAADQLHLLSCRVTAKNSAGTSQAVASSNAIKVSGTPPVNIAPPKVHGRPAVKETLTCEKGTWTGLPPPSYSYRWVRDRQTPSEEAVGSTESYVVPEADRGHSLACEVTASNEEGPPVTQASENVVVAAEGGGTPPSNGEAPKVYGAPELGASLYCAPGSWSGNPAPIVTVQWLRDEVPIASAMKNSYLVTAADQAHSLSCRVTARNSEGVLSVTSEALKIRGVKPEAAEAPQVSGTPAVGQELACQRGAWKGAPAPTFTYQWLRDGANIPLATGPSYTVRIEDRGRSISCRVTASNSEGSTEAASSNSLEIPGDKPRNVTPPKVSGTPAVGETLACAPGAWTGNPPPTYSYQWLLGGVEIPSATLNRYTVASSDRGLSLSCMVTASNAAGTSAATSELVHVPGAKPEVVEAPQVSGAPVVGQQLKCLRGLWNGQPPPAFSYQWLRDGTGIASAASNSYTIELADQGHGLSCKVTATNSEGKSEAESKALAIPRASTESRPELTFPPAPPAPPTPAQILAALRKQLARAQHHAHISSLRKKGSYAFSVTLPVAGRLELVWYEAPTRAQHSSNSKPLAVAVCTTSFASAGTKTISLRLTSAGRRLIEHSSGLQLTLKAVFVQPHARPLTWSKTVGLTY